MAKRKRGLKDRVKTAQEPKKAPTESQSVTQPPKLGVLIHWVCCLSDYALDTLIQHAVAERRVRAKVADKEAAVAFEKGDRVIMDAPGRLCGLGGRVERVNRTRVQVDFGRRGTYLVQAGNLKRQE